MADCGAAGTTIDRAARAVLGSSSQGQEAAKHVGALLGHATTVGHQVAMPLGGSADMLTMPGFSHSSATPNRPYLHHAAPGASTAQSAAAQLDAAWKAPLVGPHKHIPHPHQQMSHPPPQMMHPSPAMYHYQQKHHMAAMFQQQQHVVQQQLQIMAAQQQQHQQQQQAHHQISLAKAAQPIVAEATVKELNENLQDDLENWHEGLEEAAAAAALQEDGTLGHEGIVHGATIEELAAAWAHAEAEYDEVAENDEEDYSNLWTGEMAQNEPSPYDFLNKEEPSDQLNWMEEGMKQFRDGNLKEAVRSFEMELQHNNPDNATAWRMLGRCHAENDMDPEAIKCLEAAVDRDPYSPESLLALGVSYVNELNHERALANMKAWCTHNPKYAGMEIAQDIYGAASAPAKESAFEEVKQLLQSALKFDSTDAGDVHEALGVIYNVIKDYDGAAESLRKALESRPADYQLWNKLGATLANGSQSDQALPAYHRALQMKPKYARAWLNMAISHSNLQDHDEAARCYLQTLSLNPGATHCWTYLRMALSCSERWDLLQLVFAQDLNAFKEHFDFVLYE